MRMISADSLLTMASVRLSHSTGTVARPGVAGDGAQVDVGQRPAAGQRIAAFAELPASFEHQGFDHGNRNHALEALEDAEDQRPVRPRAGVGDEQVVAAGLGREAGACLIGDAIAELRLAAHEPTAVGRGVVPVVVPDAVDQQAHGQPCSFLAISVVWRPWKRTRSSSFLLGRRLPSPPAMVVAP